MCLCCWTTYIFQAHPSQLPFQPVGCWIRGRQRHKRQGRILAYSKWDFLKFCQREEKQARCWEDYQEGIIFILSAPFCLTIAGTLTSETPGAVCNSASSCAYYVDRSLSIRGGWKLKSCKYENSERSEILQKGQTYRQLRATETAFKCGWMDEVRVCVCVRGWDVWWI